MKNVKTIGVIGANGQVGTELCLYLSQMTGVHPIAICRASAASVFLRLAGIECRHGAIDDPDACRRLIEGCDLIADLSLPKGSPSESRATTARILSTLFSQISPNVVVTYMSSTMAFGVSRRKPEYGNYLLAGTAYGAMKRFGEQVAAGFGEKKGNPTFVLRLGQVYGHLQSSSRCIMRSLHDGVTYVPAGKSDTVFVFTVAEALRNIALGKEVPGNYTLVSKPEWTWMEIHQYYCKQIGIESTVEVICRKPGGRNTLRPLIRTAWKRIIEKYRGELEGYVLARNAKYESALAADFRSRRVASEVQVGRELSRCGPYGAELKVVPGRRLKDITDSRYTMKAIESKVCDIINSVGLLPAIPQLDVAAGSPCNLNPKQVLVNRSHQYLD